MRPWLRGLAKSRDKQKSLYFFCHSAFGHQIGRMVTYFERLLTINSFSILITCSCKITWQKKIIIDPQPECLWLQTWQNDNLPWWVPTYKDTSPFYHVVLQDQTCLIIKLYKTLTTWSCKVAWKNILYISITRVLMAIKLGRMMTSLDGLLPIMPQDSLIMCPCEIWGSLTGGG